MSIFPCPFGASLRRVAHEFTRLSLSLATTHNASEVHPGAAIFAFLSPRSAGRLSSTIGGYSQLVRLPKPCCKGFGDCVEKKRSLPQTRLALLPTSLPQAHEVRGGGLLQRGCRDEAPRTMAGAE